MMLVEFHDHSLAVNPDSVIPMVLSVFLPFIAMIIAISESAEVTTVKQHSNEYHISYE